jgi:SWI/SNF-related matrix-associated actin-dependent regulator 1 of chromatin subfamily A
MYDRLHNYQRRAVRFALNVCRGRCLLADEMGCGKTAEALCCAAALCARKATRGGGSATVLIVCPATARQQWAGEVERWMGLEPAALHVVYDDNDGAALAGVGSVPPGTSFALAARVVVISYAMLVRLEQVAFAGLAWDVVIVDESHNMRGPMDDGALPLRTSACMALVRDAPAAILLSGTPALVRPSDLYFQVHSLRPGLLGATPLEFALNYMTACVCPHVEFRDCHRPAELQLLLRTAVMARTTKEVALRDQIPRKRRVVWRLATLGVTAGMATEDADLYQMRYHQAGIAKVHAAFALAVQRVIAPLAAALRDCGKRTTSAGVVLFAHHHDVLNEVERRSRMLADTLPWVECTVMRIDGTVPARLRQERLRVFQEACGDRGRPQLRIACLSMTAAGIAIDLTSAAVCVFLELPPDASWLKQCEDRLHRRGQQLQVTSCLCVNDRCEFDSPHLSRLRRSMHSIDAVLEDDATYSPHDAVGSVLQVPPSHPGLCSSPEEVTAADTAASDRMAVGQIDFLVSRWSGRIHLFKRAPVSDGAVSPVSPAPPTHMGSIAAMALTTDSHCCDFASDSLQVHDPQVLWRAARAFHEAWNALTPKQQRNAWLLNVPGKQKADITSDSALESATANRQPIFTRYVTTVGSDAPGASTASTTRQVRVRFISSVQSHSARELDIPYRWIAARTDGDSDGNATVVFDCLSCGRPLDAGHSDVRVFVASAVCTRDDCDDTKIGQESDGTAEPPAQRVVCVSAANADVAFYCSRDCRLRYRARRMRHPLRRAVDERDCGICAACEVDCAAVLSALEAVVGVDPGAVIRARLATLRAMHPAFHSCSAAAARLVEHPSPGLFWHADHVTPVWQGGGGAIPEEVQTLCVACHLAKTNDEACLRRRIREE